MSNAIMIEPLSSGSGGLSQEWIDLLSLNGDEMRLENPNPSVPLTCPEKLEFNSQRAWRFPYLVPVGSTYSPEYNGLKYVVWNTAESSGVNGLFNLSRNGNLISAISSAITLCQWGVTIASNPNLQTCALKIKNISGSALNINDCPLLENFDLAVNGYYGNIQMSGSPLLTNASLVSIANGLNESVTDKTLTLHATPKAKCSTITGTVSLDSTGTYHIFTEDASGATTLADFITNTKGWTLA